MGASESGVYICLSRNKTGILVTVKIDEVFSNFIKSLGSGEKQPLTYYFNDWTIPDQPTVPLEVWHCSENASYAIQQYVRCRIDLPGPQLTYTNEVYGGNGQETLNLGFLRLVGASEGITFQVKNSLVSNSALIDLRSRILNGCKQIYVDFVRQIEVSGRLTKVVQVEEQKEQD